MAFVFNVLSHAKCHLVLTADYGDTEDKNDHLHLVLEEPESSGAAEMTWNKRTFTGLLGSRGHAFATHQVAF